MSSIIFVTYIFIAKDALLEVYTPQPKKLRDYAKLLQYKDTWWFNLFYAVSFRGFVGFAGYMKVYFINSYQADMSAFGVDSLNEPNVKVVAGYFGVLCLFLELLLKDFSSL